MAEKARRRSQEREYEVYAEGNALRRVEAVPSREEERRQGIKPINVQARRNRARAMQLSPSQAAVLLAATLFMGILCCRMIMLQSQVSQIRKNIRQSQAKITEYRILSDSIEDSVRLSTDLDYIYKVATKRLGMVYPTEEQVIRFERTELEYVRQFEEIPIAD